MHEFNIDVNQAMAWAANYHTEAEAKFLEGLKRVPSWGSEIDRQVAQYLNGIANWPRGQDCWNFEGGRYLGSKAPEIRKTRQMPLIPKVSPPIQDASLRQGNVVIANVDDLVGDPQGAA